jgi:hypothetical protein
MTQSDWPSVIQLKGARLQVELLGANLEIFLPVETEGAGVVHRVPATIIHPDRDPFVFGPPGSWSVSQGYGSGSGYRFFSHQAKIISKTLIPTVLWLLFAILSLKNYVNVPSKSKKQKN